ncbi:Protein IQ-domain 14 [Vitis vinifera]|uniref:Protein IQ-domain 14 n=1 Tax=Vitis vinifera TaxID=29760 RepID=A0A438I608_VITVI|nr:Protein IQ-domain 14 [Vitis vinifera]
MPVKKRGSSHMAHQWRGPNFLGGYLTGKIPTVHQDAQDRLALHILIFISFLEEPSPEGLSVISFKLTFEPVVNGSCESDSRRRKKARGGPMVWIAFFMNHYKVSQPVHFIERLLGHAIFSMVVASSSIFSACVLEGRQAKLESLDGKKGKLVQFGEGGFHFRGKEKRGKVYHCFQKSKRWKWVFTRLKLKQCPALAAPCRTLTEARDEQKKHAMTVALATAAAAEAAVAAAHAAAEVVRLTGTPQSYHTCDKRNQNLAAIKIQTAFRGHLARKALRALKGLVRLQALIRGQILRRQVITTLKCLPSTANNQAQVNKRGVLTANESYKDSDNRKFLRPKELGGREIKDYVIEQLEGSSKKSWDCSMLLKEDMETIWLRKQEAVTKRERMKKYSSSHRERINAQMTEETESYKENGKWNSQFEQWMDAREYEREELENSNQQSI